MMQKVFLKVSVIIMCSSAEAKSLVLADVINQNKHCYELLLSRNITSAAQEIPLCFFSIVYAG